MRRLYILLFISSLQINSILPAQSKSTNTLIDTTYLINYKPFTTIFNNYNNVFAKGDYTIFNKHTKSWIKSSSSTNKIGVTPIFSIDQNILNISENDLALGAKITGNVKNKFRFVFEGFELLTDTIISNRIRTNKNLVPGYIYSQQNSNNLLLTSLRFRLGYKPSKLVNFQVGIDNHFIGDGFRSLFLSSSGTPIPFAQISSSFWIIDYTVQYNLLKDINYPDFSNQQNKYLTSHTLNFKIHPKFHLYAYEAVIWQSEDSLSHRRYDFSYLNPVIFFRSVEFQLGYPSPDNVLLGIGYRWKIYKNIFAYGQTFFDEFSLKELKAKNGWWANKFALQAGIKYFHKTHNSEFVFLTEYNMARPFTFTHIHSTQNYGNKYFALGHPLGANFQEFIVASTYTHNNINLKLLLSLAQVGVDSAQNIGHNIYMPYTSRINEYGYSFLCGTKQNLIGYDLSIGYNFKKLKNTKLTLGISQKPIIENIYDINDNRKIYIRISSLLINNNKKLFFLRGLYN